MSDPDLDPSKPKCSGTALRLRMVATTPEFRPAQLCSKSHQPRPLNPPMSQPQFFPFTLAIDGIGETLRVVSFRGHEEVNQLYIFELVVAMGRAAGSLEELALNRAARLTIEARNTPRIIIGIVHSVRLMTGRKGWVGDVYRIVLVPKLWRLKPTRNSRIFQKLSIPQIVNEVLDLHGIERRWATVRKPSPPKQKSAADDCYPRRTYCVQYLESDFDFVCRLLSEEGLFFSFDPPDPSTTGATEVMVIADSASCYRPIDGSPQVPMRDDTMVATAEAIDSLEWGGQLLAGATLLREYDFERPTLELKAQAESGDVVDSLEAAFRVYNHEGRFSGEHVTELDAQIQLEQLRSQRRTGRGSSWCTRLTPGRTFQLVDAPTERLNGSYVVTSVDHEASDPTFTNTDDGGRSYSNRFVCLPADVTCRPSRQPRQIQQTFETATVVGPTESEIHTDQHGRIKVQFHWDLKGKRNAFSSCWLRMIQTWAGAGWGHQFIPRVGMEVLVLLLGGDIDNPMVVGSVYNGANPSPFALPESKTRSGLRTRSSPKSDGFNELSFEDLADHEEVYLHAQRNLREHVLHDHGTTVLNDQKNDVIRHQVEIVGGNQTLAVRCNRSETVDMNMTRAVLGHEVVAVDGNQTVTIGCDRRESVEGDHKENVDGSHRQRIGRNASLEVGDNLGVRATGDFNLEVTGQAVSSLSSDGVLTVAGDHHTVIEGNQTISVGHDSRVDVQGALTLLSSAFTLGAGGGFAVTCGESSIIMRDDSVEIRSPKLILTGDEEVMLRAADESILKLDGNGQLIAEKVEIQAAGSELLLDSNAKLGGGKVSLGSGQGKASYSVDEDDKRPPAPPELKLRFLHDNDENRPYADERVTVSGHAPTPWQSQTDGDGRLSFPVHYERCTIQVEMPDQEMRWLLRHGNLADIEEETERGVRQRLGNIGYGAGNANYWTEREFLQALRAFEQDAGGGSQDDGREENAANDEILRPPARRESADEVAEEIERLAEEYRDAIREQAGQ